MGWTSVPMEVGRFGYHVLKADITITGAFWAIQTLSRTVFESLVDAAGTSWTLISIPAGIIIYGSFTYAEMTSCGCAIMYHSGAY
jgi:hypothetical protein